MDIWGTLFSGSAKLKFRISRWQVTTISLNLTAVQVKQLVAGGLQIPTGCDWMPHRWGCWACGSWISSMILTYVDTKAAFNDERWEEGMEALHAWVCLCICWKHDRTVHRPSRPVSREDSWRPTMPSRTSAVFGWCEFASSQPNQRTLEDIGSIQK